MKVAELKELLKDIDDEKDVLISNVVCFPEKDIEILGYTHGEDHWHMPFPHGITCPLNEAKNKNIIDAVTLRTKHYEQDYYLYGKGCTAIEGIEHILKQIEEKSTGDYIEDSIKILDKIKTVDKPAR